MHKIITSIRQIPPADLPKVRDLEGNERPVTDQELLNFGLQRIDGDYFSAIEQHERDEETLEWKPKDGRSLPGTVISEGTLKERHDKLPNEVRAKVLKASVIRSETGNAREKATKVLKDAAKEARRVVGDVGGEPLIDVTDPELIKLEAIRLADSPDSDLKRETVRMADVADGEIVEADSIIPQSWQGEPKR